jgi:hypothetical protein
VFELRLLGGLGGVGCHIVHGMFYIIGILCIQ